MPFINRVANESVSQSSAERYSQLIGLFASTQLIGLTDMTDQLLISCI